MKSLNSVKTYIFYIDLYSKLTEFESLISKYDCLIINYYMVFEKLSKFTHLILYENLSNIQSLSTNQNYFELCKKLNIKYVEFEKYKTSFHLENNIGNFNNEMIRTILCSQNVAKNTFLIEFFEIEMGIRLITRNYEFIILQNNLNNSFISNADLLINENVGIVFQESSFFINYFEEELNLFLKKIFNFRFNLENLFVIFTHSEIRESNITNFSNHQNFLRFLKFCKDSNQNNSKFKLNALLIENLESLKNILKRIIKIFQPKFNLKITNEPTLDEIFLVSLGCFNAFDAQSILQTCSITDLISMNLSEFKLKFNFIDSEKIKHFFNILEVNED